MGFALIIIGLVLVISTVRNTQDDLVTVVKGDFTGTGNFLYWIVAVLIIGGIGYIKSLKGLSDAFLVLLFIVLFLKRGNPNMANGGFFNQFVTAINAVKGGSGSSTTTISVPGVTPTGGLVTTSSSGNTTTTLPGFGG